ncbi:MAG: glycosyltransferase [Pirellulales bacterium]|nr:glycosyltransferase [Pirellulales bacterium]
MSPNSPVQRLTVAVIVRDAESALAATLDSVRELADEIVVVDTGSRDRTLEIARRRATKVCEFPWCDDFSAARNAAWPLMTGDWVLWLDAGETVSAESAAQIRQFVDRQARPECGYLLLIQISAAAASLAATTDLTQPELAANYEQAARLRLLPRRGDLRYVGLVREQIHFDAQRGMLEVCVAPGIIQRQSAPNESQLRQARAARNLRLAEREDRQTGASARLELVRGDAYLVQGQPEQARLAYRRGVELAERGSAEMLEAYYGWLTACDEISTAKDEQLAVAAAALEIFPLDAQLHCAVGTYLLARGRADLAARSFQMAAEHGQINLETWHLVGLAEISASCWAKALEMLGQTEQALKLLERLALSEDASERLLRQLLDFYIARDRRQAALELVRRLPMELSARELLRTVVRGACLAAQGNFAAALPFLRAAYDGGCRENLCYVWLANCLQELGLHGEVSPILADWQRHWPRSAEYRRKVRESGARVMATPVAPRVGGTPPAENTRQQRVFRHDPLPLATGPAPFSPPLALPTAGSAAQYLTMGNQLYPAEGMAFQQFALS